MIGAMVPLCPCFARQVKAEAASFCPQEFAFENNGISTVHGVVFAVFSPAVAERRQRECRPAGAAPREW